MIRLSKINELDTTTYTITIPNPTTDLDTTDVDATEMDTPQSLIGLVTKVKNYYSLISTETFTEDENAIIMAILNNHVNEGCSVAGKAEELSVEDIV